LRSSSARRRNPPHDLIHIHRDPCDARQARPYSVDALVDLPAGDGRTQSLATDRNRQILLKNSKLQ
jgi:hypothetical protein